MNPQSTVLVVEDDNDSRHFFCSLLSMKGYAVVEARNGKEGILVASRTHPDLIIMDLAMPQMDGIEAVRHILQVPKLAGTPILAVSAFAIADVKDEARAAGCLDVLDKPVDIDNLLAKVEGALAARPASQELLGERERNYEHQREAARVQTSMPVKWGLTEACSYTGTITSLSVGGCLISTELIETLDAKPVNIKFELPHERSMTLRGEALYYLKNVGFGIKFQQPTDEDTKTLTLLVEQRRPRQAAR
ncbi:MAG: response regulator [Pyrinomonadaceae bacterium]|nr:response regulator [Pyrinomonadaceae bacterium]